MEYSQVLHIEENQKLIVYARITDASDNSTVINSDGIVLYSDAQAVTQSVTYTRTSNEDVTAQVNLNGNTVAGIMNGSDSLTAGTDYTDPEVLNQALANLKWEDSMGEHFFREYDHCLTNTLFFGTADTLNEETQTPICSDIKAYTWEEAMPSKADYREYCESIGFDHQGRVVD